MKVLPVLTGVVTAIAGRAALVRAVRFKLDRDVAALNDGDYGPLLAGFADDAVLRFNEGDHRWSGDHVGKPAIERFLQDFVAAGLQGEVKDLALAGPPWDLRLVVRFDDESRDPTTGEVRYANRTCLYVRTRWGRIVEQQDFYEDTGRILALEQRLRGA